MNSNTKRIIIIALTVSLWVVTSKFIVHEPANVLAYAFGCVCSAIGVAFMPED